MGIETMVLFWKSLTFHFLSLSLPFYFASLLQDK